MGPLLPPWQVARFDQIDAAIRDLVRILHIPTARPQDTDLPADPFCDDPRSAPPVPASRRRSRRRARPRAS